VQELGKLVAEAQRGNPAAFNLLVCRFQDGAVAYAFSVLGDFQKAEDAAQEAFLEAFQCLPTLREPLAFPGWLRRIVFKQCDRITRRKQVETVSLEAASGEPQPRSDPQTLLEQSEITQQIWAAIATLPEGGRSAILLFYFGRHSHAEIAAFLDMPVTAVKKRLFTARRRLKKEMTAIMQENLDGQRPSRNSEFADRVRVFTAQLSQQINSGQSLVRSLAALAEQEQNAELRQAIMQIQSDITGDGRRGATPSEALSKHPNLFTPTYIGAIRQGEVDGNLADVLQRLGGG